MTNYTIEVSAADLKLIGQALDAMPHGIVSALVKRVQTQIDAQETILRDRDSQEREIKIAEWYQGERDKIRAELAAEAAGEEPAPVKIDGADEALQPEEGN